MAQNDWMKNIVYFCESLFETITVNTNFPTDVCRWNVHLIRPIILGEVLVLSHDKGGTSRHCFEVSLVMMSRCIPNVNVVCCYCWHCLNELDFYMLNEPH